MISTLEGGTGNENERRRRSDEAKKREKQRKTSSREDLSAKILIGLETSIAAFPVCPDDVPSSLYFSL